VNARVRAASSKKMRQFCGALRLRAVLAEGIAGRG
jgi:hypothetical protein